MSRHSAAALLLPRVDLRRRGKEPLSVPDLDHVGVADLPIRAARYDLEQVSVGTNRCRRNMAELQPRHVLLRDRVVHPVNLDMELVRMVPAFPWIPAAFALVAAHEPVSCG